MSASQEPTTEEDTTDPRLSYLLSPKHPSVTSLLESSLTELIPPPPLVPRLPPTVSTTSLHSEVFVVKDNLVVERRRDLFTKDFCCCSQAQSATQNLSGWDENKVSLSSHFVHIQSSPNSKLEQPASKHGGMVTKSSSTGKIEVSSKHFKGYPFEKTDIPFYFKHLEGDKMVSSYGKLYRTSYTYPNLEDRLKSSNSSTDYTSYSAPSVIEPKLLLFGIGKPGVADSHRHSHHRQYSKFHNMLSSAPQIGEKKTHSSATHHSLDNHATKSTSILEVFHGQSSTDHQLNNLPHPASPDSSPPITHQTTTHKQSGQDNQTSSYAVQFKDIININDTQCLKNQKKPNVKWASHKFPSHLVSSGNHSATTKSPKQMRQHVQPANARKTRGASFPRARNAPVHFSRDVPNPGGLLDLTATSFTKITPKTKELSSTRPQNENRAMKVQREGGTSHAALSHEHLAQSVRRNRFKQPTSNLSLMPTSKALVPSLGIYSRTSLAQRSVDYF